MQPRHKPDNTFGTWEEIDQAAAIAWYHDTLGMIVVHEEVNTDQGVREAMLSVRGAPRGSAQLQLMAPLDDTCTIAQFIGTRGPGIQQLAYRVSDLEGLAMFTARQRRGIPSRLLYFPDENHWVLKPQNSVQWHDTVLGWLAQWLGAEGPKEV